MDGGNALAAGPWVAVCPAEDIWPNIGVAALVAGRQVAIFRVLLPEGERYFAVDNYDPQSEANVLSRGLIGSLGDRVVVASPIYKQHYDLVTGECLEDASTPIRAYQVKLADGQVWVAA
jgi:nitrite reductase (NADH) small subunit